ncbi:membrane protein [Pectobacterium phage vB_PcaM_CBB]|uniref:Putative membrane protein n=1 Tax=Pectobacterium phage vB_PcaM_CBB TaxID=2772511 RepID=A0A1L2CVI3_9CAUD|nr:membrane protein [Pectobacterium phage vB_PcaM_CBB]AMM44006.1 putative membrane protein [Pectobacterium phage vB_PcaM_CBB]
MKYFSEVLFLALALILFVCGQTGLAIFSAMFCVIAWMWPHYKEPKTAEQLMAEADPGNAVLVFVEYEFNSNKGETFTAELHHDSTIPLTEEEVLTDLAEHVTEHTGIPIDASRLHVLKFNQIAA